MKKNVLFVINSMGRAGAERVLISLLRTMNKEEFDIDFFSVINRGEMFLELPDYVNVINKNPSYESVLDRKGRIYLVKVVLKALFKRCYIFRYNPYLIRNFRLQKQRDVVKFDKLFWHALSESHPMLEKEYDLAIAYTEGASTYYVANYVKSAKKAAFVHVDYTAAGYMKSLDKHYYDKFDKIFPVSQSVRDDFVMVYPEYSEKTTVYQNMVIPHEIIEASKKGDGFTDDFDGLRILTVARLHPQKALDIAIPAFAKLIKMGYDNVKWYIVGEGTERPLLERLISRHKLQDKFILLGMRTNPYPFFYQCDIYVQASHFEGWSIALAEALVLSKPTVASNSAGTKEQIVPEETGIIINLSEENLTEALKRIVDSKQLRDKFSGNLQQLSVDYARDLKLLYELVGMEYR